MNILSVDGQIIRPFSKEIALLDNKLVDYFNEHCLFKYHKSNQPLNISDKIFNEKTSKTAVYFLFLGVQE